MDDAISQQLAWREVAEDFVAEGLRLCDELEQTPEAVLSASEVAARFRRALTEEGT